MPLLLRLVASGHPGDAWAPVVGHSLGFRFDGMCLVNLVPPTVELVRKFAHREEKCIDLNAEIADRL